MKSLEQEMYELLDECGIFLTAAKTKTALPSHITVESISKLQKKIDLVMSSCRQKDTNRFVECVIKNRSKS